MLRKTSSYAFHRYFCEYLSENKYFNIFETFQWIYSHLAEAEWTEYGLFIALFLGQLNHPYADIVLLKAPFEFVDALHRSILSD